MDFPNGFGYLRHLRKGTWCEPMTKTTDEEILALLAEMDESEIEKYLLTLNEDEQAEIAKLLADAPIWFPLEDRKWLRIYLKPMLLAMAAQQVAVKRI